MRMSTADCLLGVVAAGGCGQIGMLCNSGGLDAAGITEGAIFRRIFNKRAQRITDRRLAPRNVAAIVKQGAAPLGFDPSTFGGHSLRAGFLTSAVKRGANLIKITDVTGHRSLEMLKTYSRDAEAFVGHAGAGLL
jgi:hypothetical protein